MEHQWAFVLLQLVLCFDFIAAQQKQQIYFPDEMQSSASAPVSVPNIPNNKVNYNNNQDPSEAVITRGLTKLTLDVNRVVPDTSPYLASANSIVYGPLTIAGALCLALLASIGQTSTEIANALGFSSGFDVQNNPLVVHEHIGRLTKKLASNTGFNFGEQVTYALAIFVQEDYPIRPAYEQASREIYGSDIVNVDFKRNPAVAQNVINSWVSDRTNAKIPSLLNDFPPPNTQAIIVGVLYFKAAWEFPFFEGHTKWRPFFVNGRKNPSDRMVEMMSNGGDFPYHKDSRLGVEIMGFPYKGNRTTMYVIIPRDSNTEQLKRLEATLTPEDIEHLVSSTRYTEAVILFPKMKLESTINLRPTLQTLGINSLFSPYQANLALLTAGSGNRFDAERAPFLSQPALQQKLPGPPQNLSPSSNRPQDFQQSSQGFQQGSQGFQQSSQSFQPSSQGFQQNSQNFQQNAQGFGESSQGFQESPQGFRQGTQGFQQNSQTPQGAPPPQRPTESPHKQSAPRQPTTTRRPQVYPPQRPTNYPQSFEDGLIFTRFGSSNCDQFYDPARNRTVCRPTVYQQNNRAKRAPQSGSSNARLIPSLEGLDAIRRQVITNPDGANPLIYADEVIHKVYMDITESGTEAAAATGISLNRSGGRVTFRVDIPFLFFIYNEDTKIILFWGSVKSPSPSIATPST